MAAYAGKLSLVTTLTGMLFTGVAADAVGLAAPRGGGAVPGLVDPASSLRARRRWLAPAERARVVLTVAAV